MNSEKAERQKLSQREIITLIKPATKSLETFTSSKLIDSGRKISVQTVDESKYIMKVSKPHFDVLTNEKIHAIEDAYPSTIKTLFAVAFCIIDGSFGIKLRDAFISDISYPLSFNAILVLMLMYLSKMSPENAFPEIFQQYKQNPIFEKNYEQLKTFNLNSFEAHVLEYQRSPHLELKTLFDDIKLIPSSSLVLLKLFHNFIDNLVNPSHLLIDLLIHKMDVTDQAIDTALLITNLVDRSKSLELVIYHLLEKNEINQALVIWKLIPMPREKYKASVKIADKLIEMGQIEEALKFSNEIKEPESHDQILREAALKMAKQHMLNKALEVMGTIQNSDIRHYTQSNLVHILCSQYDFFNAKKLALQIGEAGFKEDAIIDIIKNYIARRKFEEAIQFAYSLANPYEKRKSAHLIEASLKIHHQDAKVSEVRKIFSLLNPLRMVA